MDDRDLFSYDNSKKDLDESMESFDLNSFSTVTPKTENGGDRPEKKDNSSKKAPKAKKRNIAKTVLTLFLVCVITR